MGFSNSKLKNDKINRSVFFNNDTYFFLIYKNLFEEDFLSTEKSDLLTKLLSIIIFTKISKDAFLHHFASLEVKEKHRNYWNLNFASNNTGELISLLFILNNLYSIKVLRTLNFRARLIFVHF